jgi:8-oxo-dGTP pyrophosphatase MutT (NUDIX family)
MVPIRDAATVMLLREAPGGPQVLMLRRHPQSGFFGDAYAFPGGKLDDSDYAPEALALLPRGLEPRIQPTPGRELTRAQAFGLYVAACRELFEEAGIVLARGWRAPADVAALRKQVGAGDVSFASILGGLALDAGALAFVAHLVTPSVEQKRFDARFFLALAPGEQEASRDAREITDAIWRTPAEVVAAHSRRELMLPPPTFLLLEQLAAALASATAAEVVAEWGARRVQPIMPKLILTGGGAAVLLPWDDDYAAAQGDAFAIAYAPELTRGASRVEMVEGRWRSRRVVAGTATTQ